MNTPESRTPKEKSQKFKQNLLEKGLEKRKRPPSINQWLVAAVSTFLVIFTLQAVKSLYFTQHPSTETPPKVIIKDQIN